ncbi:hypothetical protein [Blastomonas sp. SL216]|uniref:hypothetical protein n=1 Tax=Blastomonas sp. SL216 TaxID=2995169 RepID=UPI0023776CCB|nr:hypothetical protein OU999_15540 [Blastomonas sp. SL216]
MNTFIRLLVLVPATVLVILIAWLSIGFAGLSLWSVLFCFLVLAFPVGLVVWTIRDHRRRKAQPQTGQIQ